MVFSEWQAFLLGCGSDGSDISVVEWNPDLKQVIRAVLRIVDRGRKAGKEAPLSRKPYGRMKNTS